MIIRSREEIEKDFKSLFETEEQSAGMFNKTVYQLNKHERSEGTQKLILEVLLDIRDIIALK